MEVYFDYLIFVLIPVSLANIFHMLIVKADALPRLKIPIHERWFGAHKTWRGFLFLPAATALIAGTTNSLFPTWLYLNIWLTGALLGWTYALAELPNSFIKRRMGIAAGKSAPRFPRLWLLADKTDSALGVALVTWFIMRFTGISAYKPSMGLLLLFFVTNSLVHIMFSLILLKLNIKKSL